MYHLYERTRPIPQDDLEGLREQLEHMQGNILKGHGRDYTVHIFVRFHAPPEAVKAWIHAFASRVTSAYKQYAEARDRQQYNLPGGLFINCFLSAQGYTYLGHSLRGHDPAFREGMPQRQGLNDPARETWETGYQQAIHAMLLLADDEQALVLREARQLVHEVRRIAHVCTIEYGNALRNEQQEHIEHFGYVDGRSQPLFLEDDILREQTTGDGITKWNPSAGPRLVLVRDPQGGATDCGSYLVFRKLEQNVRGFKARERELAAALGLTGEDAERAGALVVGRFEDGTPVVLQHTDGMHHPVPNNFTYADDPDGRKCPWQAHIRKMNPRGDIPGTSDAEEAQHRIARRGIPYGQRLPISVDADPEALPTAGVGLLFMCYQRDIAAQFEFLQARWADDPDFIRHGTGIDPVIGQSQDGGEPPTQHWPTAWGAPRSTHQPFRFHGFVQLRGGEYFFAPSIRVLKTL